MALTAEPHRLAEPFPSWAVAAHSGLYSLHMNDLSPAPWTGTGLIELTFGPDRRFQLVSRVRHAAEDRLYSLGLALRRAPGRSELISPLGEKPDWAGPLELLPDHAGLRLRARGQGNRFDYEMLATVREDQVSVVERTPGFECYKSLLVPYVRNCGAGRTTRVGISMVCGDLTVWFRHGAEVVRLNLEGPIGQALDQPMGYSSCRGPCGLLRIDLAHPTEAIRYSITVET